MTALLLTACVGMITGAFLIFRISLMDFTLGVFRRLTAGPKSIRDEINEATHRKKPGLFRREISEAGQAVSLIRVGRRLFPWSIFRNI